jgi:hypothetical protein
MRPVIVVVAALLLGAAASAQSGASKTVRNLQISVGSVARAASAPLNDCPPGSNRVNATARGGEELAVVTLNFKVLPGFQPGPMKRPTLTDAGGKVYNTAVSFVDVEKAQEFSCAIPFRVPAGTKLKSVQVEGASLDLP